MNQIGLCGQGLPHFAGEGLLRLVGEALMRNRMAALRLPMPVPRSHALAHFERVEGFGKEFDEFCYWVRR